MPGSNSRVLSQFNAWEVESAWSSCFPFGNVTSSWMYCASHGAFSGKYTKPFSMVLVTVFMRMILSMVQTSRWSACPRGSGLAPAACPRTCPRSGRSLLPRARLARRLAFQCGILHLAAQHVEKEDEAAPHAPAVASTTDTTATDSHVAPTTYLTVTAVVTDSCVGSTTHPSATGGRYRRQDRARVRDREEHCVSGHRTDRTGARDNSVSSAVADAFSDSGSVLIIIPCC